MNQDQPAFIATSPLLFIASRNQAGHLDVSPRGGQPSVLRIDDAGRLLLPDMKGNRRLDTLGNVLSEPEVELLLVRDGEDRFLRIAARAELSTAPEVLRAFPADETPPQSVLVLTPETIETVETDAFRRSGFWVGPDGRKPPLDALALLRQDRAHFDRLGIAPVLKNAEEEQRLTRSGLRETYGSPGDIVREKGTRGIGPGSMTYVADVRLLVVARLEGGRIRMDLVAEGAPVAIDGGTALRLPRPADLALDIAGEIGALLLAPGRTDLQRLNGTYRATNRDLLLTPREAYLHCAASLSRSLVWQGKPPVPWSGRRRFTCTRITDEAPGVKSFVLRANDAAPIDPVAPGQYVSVSLPADPKGLPRRRSYSVSGRPDAQSLRVTVRRIGKGGLSDVLHDRLSVGDTVLLGVPAGRFVLDSSPGRTVVLVSAGVGITPLLPMLATLVEESTPRQVHFVHAARSGAHHLFREEVAQIISHAPHGHITTFTAYSQPLPGDSPDHIGRLDAGALARLADPATADFYICGPLTFMEDLRAGLMARGAGLSAIRTEAFEAEQGGNALAVAMAGRPSCTVTFAKSGKVVQWTAGRGTLLDLAVSEGLDVPYSCRMGDCQSCVQRLLGGRVDHPSLAAADFPEGHALLCQALPDGDIKLDC